MTTSQFIKQHLDGTTMYRLSKLTGISATNINNYVSGKAIPSIDKFKEIVKALNIHKDDLNNFFYEH